MKRVLIVEDDVTFAGLLKEFLHDDLEFQVVGVLSSEYEARSYMSDDNLKDVDCILLDLALPRLQSDTATSSNAGIRLLEELRNVSRYFGTVIVLTNSRDLADGEKAMIAGCDGFLCKNAAASEINTIVEELKMAIRGDVLMVSKAVRHVFFRQKVSMKEAQLMDYLCDGSTWTEIANKLGYKTSKNAANIGDRIFDKLIPANERMKLAVQGLKKRKLAMDIWKARRKSTVGVN